MSPEILEELQYIVGNILTRLLDRGCNKKNFLRRCWLLFQSYFAYFPRMLVEKVARNSYFTVQPLESEVLNFMLEIKVKAKQSTCIAPCMVHKPL